MAEARAESRWWSVSALAWLVVLAAVTVIVSTGTMSQSDRTACAGLTSCLGVTGTAPGNLVQTAHLLAAAATGLGAVTLSALAQRRLGFAPSTMIPAALAGLQVALVLVPDGLVSLPWLEAARLGVTALVLAAALYLAAALGQPLGLSLAGMSPAAAGLARLAALAVLLALVTGAYLTPASATSRCESWPVCTPVRADAHLLHRGSVAGAALLIFGFLCLSYRARHAARHQAPLLGLLVLFTAATTVGAWAAVSDDSQLMTTAHFAVAGLTWALLVALLAGAQAGSQVGTASAVATAGAGIWRDYLRVTKPGIMLLLLTTTMGAMLAASDSWPSLPLVLATMAGGALASGGASALNCYLDRDIDTVMARTRRRPLPTGHLAPLQVLTFGLLLSALAVTELALLVNATAALLALAGNLFYVVVYTRFLKRATPQNIVIGGAAGSFPPLVGWAAVTGTVTLPALLLFAIIFYWTPPHFWSLALLKARDYERAGIPMLPVTHGDAYTRRMILLYAVLLVPVTLLLVPAGGAGTLYLVLAVALGAIFTGYALRMYREGTSRLAWPLFKYSNYYLALILAALVLDRVLAR